MTRVRGRLWGMASTSTRSWGPPAWTARPVRTESGSRRPGLRSRERRRPSGSTGDVARAARMPGASVMGTSRAPKVPRPEAARVASSMMISPVSGPLDKSEMVAEPATACPESLRMSGTGRTGAVRASSRASCGAAGRPQLAAAADSPVGMNATSAHRLSARMSRVMTAFSAESEPATTTRRRSSR